MIALLAEATQSSESIGIIVGAISSVLSAAIAAYVSVQLAKVKADTSVLDAIKELSEKHDHDNAALSTRIDQVSTRIDSVERKLDDHVHEVTTNG